MNKPRFQCLKINPPAQWADDPEIEITPDAWDLPGIWDLLEREFKQRGMEFKMVDDR